MLPPRIRPLLTAGLAALVVALGACSAGAASPTPSVTPSPSPTSTPSASPSLLALPSLGNADAALEALIPDTIGGIVLEKSSMRGSDFLTSSSASPATVAFLQALGVSASDVGVAFGIGVDSTAGNGVVMFVFRAAGADSARLVATFKQASNTGTSTPYTWGAATVAGKSVEVTTAASSGGVKLYLYAHGDTLFLVGATTADQVTEALSKLP